MCACVRARACVFMRARVRGGTAGSSRVADNAGDCVCSGLTTEIRGACVSLVMLIPCIGAPILVVLALIALYYHQAPPLLIPSFPAAAAAGRRAGTGAHLALSWHISDRAGGGGE